MQWSKINNINRFRITESISASFFINLFSVLIMKLTHSTTPCYPELFPSKAVYGYKSKRR